MKHTEEEIKIITDVFNVYITTLGKSVNSENTIQVIEILKKVKDLEEKLIT